MTIPRSEDFTPGTWRNWQNMPNQHGAVVTCPTCGNAMSVYENHTIAEDGRVSPSLVCPHNDCTFHEFVTLEGWKA